MGEFQENSLDFVAFPSGGPFQTRRFLRKPPVDGGDGGNQVDETQEAKATTGKILRHAACRPELLYRLTQPE